MVQAPLQASEPIMRLKDHYYPKLLKEGVPENLIFLQVNKTAFSNFCEKVRICLLHYLSFDYICSINGMVKKLLKPPGNTLFDVDKLSVQAELFTVFN
jgi:hypothetical protein